MSPNVLFQAALQLQGTPWRVGRSDFSGDPPTLEIGLDFARGSQFPSPQCGELCGAKRYRRETLAAPELFSIPLRACRRSAAAALPAARNSFGVSSLSQSRQWIYPALRSLRDVASSADARGGDRATGQ